MTVTLSPFGGVGVQFFNNNGTVLSGGKIYTYTAGTTTNQATYTTSAGLIQHSNPIILNSSGRVPTGEIWLTDAISYKFVLKDSSDVLIATYDNITGINGNVVNFTNQQEIQTATSGQTVFTLTTMQYQPGTGSLSVFVDGINQYGPGAQYAFLETNSTTVTFTSGVPNGASVKFTTAAINASSYGTAFDISYTPPFTASVATNVGNKLAQYVSVKDFGATGNGYTDDTNAIQAATNTGLAVYFPDGSYKTTGASYTGKVVWFGNGPTSRILSDATVLTVTNGSGSSVDNLYLENITAPWIITRNPANWSATVTPVQSNANGYQPTPNDHDIWSSLTPAQQNQNIGPVIYFTGAESSNITVSRITGRFVSVYLQNCSYSTVRDCNFRAGKNIAGITFWNMDGSQGAGYHNNAINNVISYPSFSGITYARNFDGLVEGNQVLNAGESGIKTYQDLVAGVPAYCYRMQVLDNYVKFSYYDGFDLQAKQVADATTDTRHNIVGNSVFGSRFTGFICEGKNNQLVGNYARGCGLSGIKLFWSYSQIQSNAVWDCNQLNIGSGEHQLLVDFQLNSITNNYTQQGAVAGAGIYATGAINYIANNYSVGGVIVAGTSSVYFGNVDSANTTGEFLTRGGIFSKYLSAKGGFSASSLTLTIPVTNLYSGGFVTVVAHLGGAQSSTWIIPYTAYITTVAIGTPIKANIGIDPISSVVVSGTDIVVTFTSTSTYATYSFTTTVVS
jgi:hypothetical protein